MADLGDIGGNIVTPGIYSCRSAFGLNTQSYGNDATNTSLAGTANAIVSLVHSNGAFIGMAKSNSSGIWHFYDLDDGTYYARENNTTSAWTVVVSGASVTVTRVSAGTVSFGYVG